jgi:hypothetical protein
MKASLRFLKTIRRASYVLSFLFSFSLLTSARPVRDRTNYPNHLNLGHGICQKTG